MGRQRLQVSRGKGLGGGKIFRRWGTRLAQYPAVFLAKVAVIVDTMMIVMMMIVMVVVVVVVSPGIFHRTPPSINPPVNQTEREKQDQPLAVVGGVVGLDHSRRPARLLHAPRSAAAPAARGSARPVHHRCSPAGSGGRRSRSLCCPCPPARGPWPSAHMQPCGAQVTIGC